MSQDVTPVGVGSILGSGSHAGRLRVQWSLWLQFVEWTLGGGGNKSGSPEEALLREALTTLVDGSVVGMG